MRNGFGGEQTSSETASFLLGGIVMTNLFHLRLDAAPCDEHEHEHAVVTEQVEKPGLQSQVA